MPTGPPRLVIRTWQVTMGPLQRSYAAANTMLQPDEIFAVRSQGCIEHGCSPHGIHLSWLQLLNHSLLCSSANLMAILNTPVGLPFPKPHPEIPRHTDMFVVVKQSDFSCWTTVRDRARQVGF